MLNGQALYPRLSEAGSQLQEDHALAKEPLTTFEFGSPFLLEEPETPVLRPIDSAQDLQMLDSLPPFSLDGEELELEESSAQNAEYFVFTERRPCESFSLSTNTVADQESSAKPSNSKKIRLIKDFIESELRIQNFRGLQTQIEEEDPEGCCL
mmetsp:Transcript_47799/g.55283  ORF Transcript_47799/g.55283 Transcript_47799/m.55283 type:complete len:153 (-) Transcript_47799:409-867(-)